MEVKVAGPSSKFRRHDKAELAVDALLHDMRLLPEAELAGVELRYPDGKAWSGEGEFGCVQSSRVPGADI